MSRSAKRRMKKLVLWAEILFILVLGAGMGVVLGAFYQMNALLPPDSALDRYRAPVGTKIYSSDGELLALLAEENREPVPLDRIPKVMQNAMVAIEDSRFYQHDGLDFRGLTRALVANVSGKEMAQGGSTITQQLARNMYLSPRKTISRKVKEILLAVQIERNWTKRQILEAYLNQVYFGAGAYGIQSASKIYFGKNAKDLTLPEAALLAGLPQQPSKLSPYAAFQADGNFKASKNRRDMVLDRMAELKFITADQAAKAKAAPIKVAKERPRSTGFFKAKYFVQYVVDQLRDQMGYPQDIIDKAGLKVITTLNWKMQQAAEKAARSGRDRWRRARVGEVALVCLDPHTGAVRAMVGGVNEPWEKYQYNCVTQARRMPGSAFKAFVYAAALERGDSPYSSVNAAVNPIRMPDGSVYAPKNHGRYSGPMSYTQAFAISANGAAVNVAVKVGPRNVAAMAKRLGLQGDMRAYPSIALGTSEASPLEMAAAYGVFAARGKRAEPTGIVQVRDQDDSVLVDFQPKVVDTRLKSNTILGIDVLTRAVVTSGTGRPASIVPNAHGKTGTSEEYTDAWFVGYTPDLVTAVWAGNRNNKPMAHIYGGTISAPIWAEFMKQAVEINPGKKKKLVASQAKAVEPRRPRRPRRVPRVVSDRTADDNDRNHLRVAVCPASGLLATRGCPSRVTEEYMLGEQPLVRCSMHTGSRPTASKEKKRDDTPAPAPATATVAPAENSTERPPATE